MGMIRDTWGKDIKGIWKITPSQLERTFYMRIVVIFLIKKHTSKNPFPSNNERTKFVDLMEAFSK